MDTPKRGSDAMVTVGDNNTFIGKFNIKDGGTLLDVSCFQDGAVGDFITTGECDVDVGWLTWFHDENPFAAGGLNLQRGRKQILEIFPEKLLVNLSWVFPEWKVMTITHQGTAGPSGLQPIDITGRVVGGDFFYPGGAKPFE